MTHLFIYLLKAGAWLVPFYLLYLLLFRRFSFYSLNRAYLLVAIVASFLLPLVQYTVIAKKEIQVERAAFVPNNNIIEDETLPSVSIQANNTTAATFPDILFVLAVIYFAGVAFMLFRLGKNLFSLYRIIRSSEKEKLDDYWLVYAPAQTGHASFFRYILLDAQRSDNKDIGLVIAHEQVHVQRGHSMDILLCELLKAIHWFNPFVWLYKKSLCELHEFEADALSAQQAGKKEYASTLLNMAVATHSPVTSQFSRHPLKTRITRLFKPQTPAMKKLLFLLVLPVTVALLIAFKSINRKTVPVWVNAPLVVMVDAGHGGAQGGVQSGDIIEKNIALSISEKVKQYAEASGMKVIMTRTTDADISINDRIQAAVNAQPDIVVSIHVNGDPKNENLNGIECYAGPNNAPGHAATSIKAANGLLQSLSLLNGIRVNRTLQSRTTGIGILKRVPCPAVLLECGYLTNSDDRGFITTAANQEQLAKQIVEGLVKYAGSRNAPAGDKTNLPQINNEAVPLDARVGLHNFSADGLVILDGKQVDRAVLPGINPALISKHIYYEAGNEIAVKKYGAAAQNGLLVLETKSGTGEYAFTGEAEKEKWMMVARAYYRMRTAQKYDHFTFTEIDGTPKEVLVTAGGRINTTPGILRFMLYSNRNGKFDRPLVFAVDGNEVSEAEFKEEIAKLRVNAYEWVHPFEPSKTKEPVRIEIRRLNINVWGVEGFVENLDNIAPMPKNQYGC